MNQEWPGMTSERCPAGTSTDQEASIDRAGTAIVVIIGLAAVGLFGHLSGVVAAGIFTPVTYGSESQSGAPVGAVVRSISVSLPRVLTPSLL